MSVMEKDPLHDGCRVTGREAKGSIFRGDRGRRYRSHDYRQQVSGLGMVQSVGRTGVCWDSAVAEPLWSSLKRELVHRFRFATRAEARRAIERQTREEPTRRRQAVHEPTRSTT